MQIENIRLSYSPAIACIILCCRVFIKSAKADELEQFTALHEIDWNEVYRLSASHRIRPVVYHVLVNHKIPVPATVLSQFYHYCHILSAFAFERLVESARIQQVLLQHQIPTRMYKGLDFTMTTYGNDIAMREFSDMDLIVAPQHLSDLADVMVAEGYTSNQLDYFRRFPTHFIERRKDICFEKRNVKGRLFSFEFHYKPTGYILDMPLGFSDLLGKDYLTSTQSITRLQYYHLMLISHGVSDFYPDLRSLVDLVLVAGTQSMYVPQVLQRYERLGQVLIGHLLYEQDAGVLCRSAHILKERLLTSTPLTFEEKLTMRVRFSKSSRTLLRALQFVVLPNEEDINRTRYPYFQIYYIVKPFRLLKKFFHGLFTGKVVAGGH